MRRERRCQGRKRKTVVSSRKSPEFRLQSGPGESILSAATRKATVMRIIEIEERNAPLLRRLLNIWERSVRATHRFLPEPEIRRIAEYVPAALREVPVLAAAVNGADEPVAFMGIAGNKLEMLFVAPEERGKGVGRLLLRHAVEARGVREVDVNEQNPQARGFYERLGFRVCGRSETDGQGCPYPILHMRLSADSGLTPPEASGTCREGSSES